MVEWQQTWPTEYEFYIFIDSNDHVRCKHSAILNHLYIGVPDKRASNRAKIKIYDGKKDARTHGYVLVCWLLNGQICISLIHYTIFGEGKYKICNDILHIIHWQTHKSSAIWRDKYI